jgi:hypothetical protein
MNVRRVIALGNHHPDELRELERRVVREALTSIRKDDIAWNKFTIELKKRVQDGLKE